MNTITLLVLTVAAMLVGCAATPQQNADALAQPAGLKRQQVRGGDFLLTAYVRIARADLPLTVYIEGDGRAWRSRSEPSTDPSPRAAIGLQLAAADASANVVYLARPCQFTPMADNPRCDVRYWTDKRFAPEVIAAMDAAVSHYAAQTPGQRIRLVGYSGGAAVATLLAQRRQDVAALRTVAGSLDPEAVNRWHRVSAMPASLNPVDQVAQLAELPQLHFSGEEDRIVPAALTQDFVARAGRCARQVVLPGMSHEGEWARQWPALLAQPLPCEERSRMP